MNELIESIFSDFKVNNVTIPVAFLRYFGKSATYITYELENQDGALGADDKVIGNVDYYDFDVYSKGNYLAIIDSLKEILTQNGFTWQPTRSSGDMYEDDTGYYHRTLSFAIEREEN